MKQRRPLFIGLAIVAIVGAIWYSIFLQNPPQQTLDQRVQHVGFQLKCPVCQGESVADSRSEEHTSELQSLAYLVCRLLLEKKKKKKKQQHIITNKYYIECLDKILLLNYQLLY